MIATIERYLSELANSLIDDNSISQDDYYWLCAMIECDKQAASGFIFEVMIAPYRID